MGFFFNILYTILKNKKFIYMFKFLFIMMFTRRILKVGNSKMITVPKDLELGEEYYFELLAKKKGKIVYTNDKIFVDEKRGLENDYSS